jgi:hypothetical protein
LKALLVKYGRKDIADCAVEKSDLVNATVDFCTKTPDWRFADKFDLVAEILRTRIQPMWDVKAVRPLGRGSYKCHVQHRGTK